MLEFSVSCDFIILGKKHSFKLKSSGHLLTNRAVYEKNFRSKSAIRFVGIYRTRGRDFGKMNIILERRSSGGLSFWGLYDANTLQCKAR